MDRKEIDDVIFEINNFMSLGGRTIVDATGSESIGRDVLSLREVGIKTAEHQKLHQTRIWKKFESARIHKKPVESLASLIDKELNQGIGETDIRAVRVKLAYHPLLRRRNATVCERLLWHNVIILILR
jgi:phosphotriesterase-related protein